MCGSDIKIKVNPLTYIVWTVLIVSNQTQFLLCSFVSASLHEAAHIAAYLNCGASVFSLEILPFGISAAIGKSERLSCRDEMLCAFSGPLMNLFLSALFLILSDSFIEGSEFFIYCNISFFVLNMFPIIPLDGGRIFYFALLNKYKFDIALKTVKAVSFVLILVITALGSYIFIVTGYNISVLLIGLYLFVYIFTSADSF